MKRKNMLTKSLAIATSLILGLGCLTGCGSSEEATTKTPAENKEQAAESEIEVLEEESGDYADTITLVWYPNESADNFTATREEVGNLIEQATGKKVEQKLTTDYAIAIEAVTSGSAQIGCMFGAEGYIQAKNAN